MFRTRLSTAFIIAAAAALPATAQQQPLPDGFVPGVNFLSIWDLDEDGKVTLDEIVTRRGEVFEGFDDNADGVLSAQEFAELDAARLGSMQRPEGRGRGAGRANQTLTLGALDANGDGAVDRQEYLDGAAPWLAALDGNGDEQLTADDFGPGARSGQPGPGGRQGMGQAPQGRGHGMGQGMGRQGDGAQMGRGQGRQGGGHSAGRGQGGGQPAPFQAFVTADGALWVVDSRTGHVLLCRPVPDGDGPDGFVPVCTEARF